MTHDEDIARSTLTVGVAIVTFNSREDLAVCLGSFSDTPATITLKFAVCDNASEFAVGELDAMVPAGSSLIHLAPGRNLGFAAGVNAAADALIGIGCDWIMLLNPDAWLAPDFFRGLLIAVSGASRALAPIVFSDDGRPLSQSLRESAFTSAIYALFGSRAERLIRRVYGGGVEYRSGVCLLIRRDLWTQLGGLDERYFLFGEDVDLGVRLHAAGADPVIVPSMAIVHKGSKGPASKSPTAMACLVSAKITFASQHGSAIRARALHGAFRLGALGRLLVGAIVHSAPVKRARWRIVASDTFASSIDFRWLRRRPRVLMIPHSASGVNPYVGELVKAMRLNDQVDVREFMSPRDLIAHHDIVHVQWPDAYLNARPRLRALAFGTALLGACLMQRTRGARLVWTVHNLEPHDRQFKHLGDLYMTIWSNLIDGCVHHTVHGRLSAEERFPAIANVPSIVSHHPAYRLSDASWPPDLPRPSRFVAAVGAIRRYKRLEDLIDSFCALEDEDVELVIAGIPHDQVYADRIERHALGSPAARRVHVLLRLLSDEEMAAVVEAATLLVVGQAALNSGVLVMGLSAGASILVPSSPQFLEVGERFGGHIHLYRGALDAEALKAALVSSTVAREPAALPSWGDLARDTLGLYSELLGRARVSDGP